MTHRQQLDRFHEHLVAIEQAGFRIRSQLLQLSNESPEVTHGHTDASILQIRLSQLATQLGDRNGGELLQAISDHPAITSSYTSSFQQWLASNEQIASLEHLLVEDELLFAKNKGLSHSWLHLAVFSVLGLVALTTVWGLSLRGMRSLIDQLRIEPPWALKALLGVQPYFVWILAAALLGILTLGWYLARRQKLKVGNNDELQALRRAQLAGRLSTQLASHSTDSASDAQAEGLSTSDSPLLEWACHTAPTQGLNARKVLELAKRLYMWMSLDRCQRSNVNGPKLFGALVGGAIALSASLLLFYPLVQLLRTVIDSSGLAR